MFKAKDLDLKNSVDLSKRFKDDPFISAKIKFAEKSLSELGIVKSAKDTKLGDVITSNTINDFYLDSLTNINSMFDSSKDIHRQFKEDFKSLKNKVILFSKESARLQESVEEVLLRKTLSTNSNLTVSSFKNPKHSQFYNKQDRTLNYDPGLKINLNDTYRLSISDVGLVLPKTQEFEVPILRYDVDHSESNIGHKIISETDIDLLLQQRPFSISYLERDFDSLGSVYKPVSNIKVTVILYLGQLQPINTIQINSLNNLFIDQIKYLDQNETYSTLSNSDLFSIGTNHWRTDVFTCSLLKITFNFKTSVDTNIFEDNYGAITTLLINEINIKYSLYKDTGFYISKPIQINNLVGGKLKTLSNLSPNFYLDSYLRIDSLSKKYTTYIRLFDNFPAMKDIPIFFNNKVSELPFWPSSDFTVYSDNTELILGTNYWFVISSEDTLLDVIPTIDSYAEDSISVYIKDYDPNKFYYFSSTPSESTYKGIINYTDQSVSLKLEKDQYQVYLLFFLRNKDSSIKSFPVISKYVLELFNES